MTPNDYGFFVAVLMGGMLTGWALTMAWIKTKEEGTEKITLEELRKRAKALERINSNR